MAYGPVEAIVIPLDPVESSNLAAVGYDPKRAILAVQFKSGAIFHYGSVNAKLATELSQALSKGQFFALNIKGKFPGQKMTGPCEMCGVHGWIGDLCDDCGCGCYREGQRREKR